MGYFKRGIDRRRSRDEARSLAERALEGRPWEAIPGSPPKAAAYVRFAAHALHPESLRRKGLFSLAYEHLNDVELHADERASIQDALGWFEENLKVPRFDEPRAVFFFRSTPAECMQRIWSLAYALREVGVSVEMQSFANPGRVIYEDEHQVAVVPWNDRPSI